ncbi:translation initiation factor IF-2 subunit gamma [Candidatus Woesearchaeota archaeon ex4484_78]|nr:MAG: translation initiation factor IF-2 subunit gamma [Candidatus Woesearchaeota archaeon ex4484_78]
MSKNKTVKNSESKKTELQPEVSIGLIGHVDHGKTTLVQALSGKWTDTHSEEIKRGITIRLGYADVSIYEYPGKKGFEKYGISETDPETGKKGKLLRKISLVDAPGHESLMATMLCGANIMDGAILMVSANEPCPQPQTREHLQALEIVGVKHLIVVQNKIDLVSEEAALKNYKQIKEFLKNTQYKDAPVIPMSALHNINLDVLLATIQDVIKTPKRDLSKPPLMFVARSFDINKPGTIPDNLTGGVLGGALKQGKLKIGDNVEILPGYEVEEKNIKVWKPLNTEIVSIITGSQKVEEAVPGGSLAIMTTLDPSVVKSDKLVGSVVGIPGKNPPVWYELKLETHLLERVVGAKDKLVVEPVKVKEIFMLNVNAAATVGIVTELGKNVIKCRLKRPVCAEEGSRVTISRNLGQRWRLIGYGVIKK